MCPKLPLVGMHTHTPPQGSPWCDKPNKKLEKNLDPLIINPIIREEKKFSNFCCKIQSQMCSKLPLDGVHAHTHALGSRCCDKPEKKLEKNSDSPIINLIITNTIIRYLELDKISATVSMPYVSVYDNLLPNQSLSLI